MKAIDLGLDSSARISNQACTLIGNRPLLPDVSTTSGFRINCQKERSLALASFITVISYPAETFCRSIQMGRSLRGTLSQYRYTAKEQAIMVSARGNELYFLPSSIAIVEPRFISVDLGGMAIKTLNLSSFEGKPVTAPKKHFTIISLEIHSKWSPSKNPSHSRGPCTSPRKSSSCDDTGLWNS